MLIKIIVFMLCLAIMNLLRESALFGIAISRETKFEISNNRIMMLGASIAYILTIIFTGITI